MRLCSYLRPCISLCVFCLAFIHLGHFTLATKESTFCKNGIPFLIHGDWGTPGENQTKIAEQMNTWSLDNQAKFLIALGDNFYCKNLMIRFLCAVRKNS